MSDTPLHLRPARPEPPPLSDGARDDNPPGVGLWALWREDLRTHDGDPFEPGFWAVAVQRYGNWRMGLPKPLRAPFTLAYLFLFRWVGWTCGISLPYTIRLGRRVRLWHHSGMILNARSIGDDCHIRQNTTFGIVRRDQKRGIPMIEDRVDIGCGVAILGHVRIGHDSVIGANSVVLDDVPPWTVVAGAPARVVRELTPPDGETGLGAPRNDIPDHDPRIAQHDWGMIRGPADRERDRTAGRS
jgi:serine O-acetyltransferase